MNRTIPRLIAAAGALLAALLPLAANAQSYGPDDQLLTVGASAFRGIEGFHGVIGADGYLSQPASETFSYFLAPLALPEGALIERLCLFGNDSDANDFRFVEAYLIAYKLVSSTGGPAEYVIPGSMVQTADIGYGYYCTDPLTFTLRSRIDADGDDVPDDVAYYVAAYVPSASVNVLSLGGVQVTWRRQVSPQPASPTFGDVPLDSLYSPFIEALKASDITGGCQQSPPLYCPDRPITRAEMAVFLAKALGLHWAD